VRTICDRTEVRAETLAFPDADLLAAARIDDQRLVVGGSNGAFAERRADGTLLPYTFPIDRPINDVVVDGPDRVVGVDRRGTLYEVDADRNLRSRIPLALPNATLALDEADGTVYVTASAGAYAVVRGATVAVAWDDVPAETIDLLIVGDERFAVARGVLYEDIGAGWTAVGSELLDDTRLFGDGTRFATIDATGILVRGSDRTWGPLPAPFESMGANGAIFDGTGRMLIYGEFGSLAIQDEGEPSCRLDPGITARWWDGVWNSDRGRAYIVGSNSGAAGPPAFLTIDLSDP
jgi:hypothetical protein